MIQQFVDNWFKNEAATRAAFEAKRPDEYIDIVRAAVRAMVHEDDSDDWNSAFPDPDRIHEIDDGNYQGTKLYVIGETGYRPDVYWYVRVAYGSCSGCDTLQRLNEAGWNWDDEWTGEPPNDPVASKARIDGYMTMALHVVQQFRRIEGEVVNND